MSMQKSAKPDQDSKQKRAKQQEIEEVGLETAVAPLFPMQPGYADPRLTPTQARALQRRIGNKTLGRLLIQRQMTLGPVGDKYEQEADAVARQVVANLAAPVATQRQEEEEELQMMPLVQRQEEEEEELQMKPLPAISTLQRQEEEEELQMKPLVQRHEEEMALQMKPFVQRHDEEEVQMKSGENGSGPGVVGAAGGEVGADLESAIENGRHQGQPLPDPVREPMEQAFNADFGRVRIHADGHADALNRAISARAFTSGQDVFFRHGAYSPGSREGQELLAHELTHTIQQGAASQRGAPVQAKGVRGLTAVKKENLARQLQRRETASSLAKIINVGVNVSDARGNLGQLGHAMDVWVEIDAGQQPVTPPGAKPNTVYGLEFEYWEYVNVPNDNKGAIGEKPWNDIHGIKPDASTFDVPAPGCDLTWKQAVQQAAAGTLTGKKKIGFRDIPGLFEKGGRNTERTLKFRIVFFDGDQRKEIYATQLLRMANGKLAYSAYRDSLGNTTEAHGFGGDNYEAGSQTETTALAQEPNRLQDTDLPTMGKIMATIPQEAQVAVQTFVRDLFTNQARPFIDLEMAEFASKVTPDKQERQAPSDWQNIFAKEFMTDKPGVAAGQYLIPTIPNTQRKQMVLPSGGLLIAIVTGNNILRMYYTDNASTNVSMNFIPQLAAKNWTINVRAFTEIPTELYQNSLAIFRANTTVGTLKDATMNSPEKAHLRKFVKQGDRHIVRVNDQTGPRIPQNAQIQVYDPEIRDITGDWLKAQYRNATGFIRAQKVAGTKDSNAWKDQQEGRLLEVQPYQAMEFNDAEQLKQLAQTHTGNNLALLNGVLGYMRRFAGRVGTIESVYNEEVPKLGLNVPRTVGALAHGYFVSVFEAQGNGTAVYQNLRQQFPEFQYLVKPAYRTVFGEAQLQQMLRQIRTDEFTQEVPNPNSAENQLDKALFQLGGPYTLTNFVPATGIGKFDAEYDPLTGQFKIITKVNFEFVDYTGNLELAEVREKPLDARYLEAQWNQNHKQPWINGFKQNISQVWDGKFALHCARPGWEDLVVRPVMEVREVPEGQQHYKIKVDKATLVQDHTGSQKITTQSGSSNVNSETMVAQLREFDLVDKIADPAVHAYLHAGEEKHIKNAYKTDRALLDSMLAQYGRLAYQGSTTNLANQRLLMNLIDAIKRTEIPSKLAHLHPIILEKNVVPVNGGRPNWRLAAHRANLLQTQLQSAGIRNPIQVVAGSENFNGIVVKIAPPDPQIESTFVQNWTRISAAHEFGHMIGLADEYYPAASTEMVQKMISDGLLPPNTPGNHLSDKGRGYTNHGEKQAGYARLLEETNLTAPNFAPDRGGFDVMSTSIMTAGYEVMAQHYVTFWEALTQMTAAHLDKKYWEIR